MMNGSACWYVLYPGLVPYSSILSERRTGLNPGLKIDRIVLAAAYTRSRKNIVYVLRDG